MVFEISDIPAILVLTGLLFIFLAIVKKLKFKSDIEITQIQEQDAKKLEKRGVIFLALGLIMFMFIMVLSNENIDRQLVTLPLLPTPIPTSSPTPTPTVTPTVTPAVTINKPMIWEIGIKDDNYGEFDQLPDPLERFPWDYKAGEASDRFPKEINDGKRTPINIHFSLTDEQSKNDLILTLAIESVSKDYFKVRIKTQVNVVGTYTFNNSLGKTHEIVIEKDKVVAGENTITLENANANANDRWMFWDYLSLRTKV